MTKHLISYLQGRRVKFRYAAIAASLGSALVFSSTSNAATSVYESFNYTSSNIGGANGGVGFAGAWANTRNNPNVDDVPGLIAGDLWTSGGNARGAAWSGMARSIGTTLSDAGLLDDGATLWFSVIMDLSGANLTNADLNMALTNSDRFVSNSFGNRYDLNGNASQGIGVGHTGGNIRGVHWVDSGNADGDAERNLSGASSLQLSSNGVGNPTGALIVGRIDWGVGALADETITLYNPSADLTLGAPVLAATAISALDQSTFDTLAVQFKDGTPRIDEIRFAGSLGAVIPVPEPSSVVLLGLGGLLAIRRRRD